MNPNLTVYIWKDMKFIKGMPLICNINNRDFNIWNSQKFTVVNIVGNIITLKNNSNDKQVELDLNYVTGENTKNGSTDKNFDYGFCITVYRYQGGTIKTDYNIYDVESMTREEFYTAISRGIKPENIHFNYTDKYFFKSSIPLSTIEKNHKIKDYDKKYMNGKIYKIVIVGFILVKPVENWMIVSKNI